MRSEELQRSGNSHWKNLLDVNVGSVLLIDGNWKVDSKYGRQFVAESWEETLPATVFGIEKYLGSGLIKGVGPKFAKRIVGLFGTDTMDVIECDISRLKEVEGIGEKRIRQIHESWERQKEIKECHAFSAGSWSEYFFRSSRFTVNMEMTVSQR